MSNLKKILGLGVACGACLAAPAALSAMAGLGLGSLGWASGLASLDWVLCLAPALALAFGAYLWARVFRRPASTLACKPDCSCAPPR